jgi:RNA polymerase sigma factor (sigma-70 family)
MSEATDVELLQAWRRGDRVAGNALVGRHFDAMFRFFRSRLDDGVADLVQRTFLGAVEARDSMPTSNFRAYLFGIAHKQLLMELRKLSRSRVVDASVQAAAASSGGSPSKVVLRHQEQHLLLRALRSLPLELQVVVQLYYWEELELAEIGEIVGIPTGTVKSRLFRARESIKESIRAALSAASESTLSGFDRWCLSLRDAFTRSRGGNSNSST